MGLALIRAGKIVGDPGPQPIRRASLNGRQLYSLAAGWPELSWAENVVGLYQALGRDKILVHEAFYDGVEANQGFDAFKPASLIFEYLPLGPFASLAIALDCQGPFFTLEGDELAGPLAIMTALDDLHSGRCEQALVGSYLRTPEVSWLMLLAHRPEAGLCWKAIFTHGQVAPSHEQLQALETALGMPIRLAPDRDYSADPHGCDALSAALTAAQAGDATAVWSCTADGRGLLLGLGRTP